MRLIIPILCICALISCSDKKSDDIFEEAYLDAFIQMLNESCPVDKSRERVFTLADEFHEIDMSYFERNFLEFPVDGFESYDNQVDQKKILLLIDSLYENALLTPLKSLEDLSLKPFEESIHFELLKPKKSNYCYGYIFYEPLVRKEKDEISEMIIRIVRVLEYPVDSEFYSYKIKNGKIQSSHKMQLERRFLKLH